MFKLNAVMVREKLNKQAYDIAGQMLSAATSIYTAAEMNQWPTMIAIAEKAQADDLVADSGDWSYFDSMSYPPFSGKEYGLYVLAKHATLKVYFDAVLTARNNHKAAIIATLDADLALYDIKTLWPTAV